MPTATRHHDPPARRGRLAGLAELVPAGSRVADVGTDHGRLPRLLLRSGRAVCCIATERVARRLPRPPGRQGGGRLELRAGDGLAPLGPADRLDVIVVAGLGAGTIIRILDDPALDGLGISRVVLQPQTPAGPLRAWLVERGYRLADGRVVGERGRLYELLAAEPAGPGMPEPVHPDLDRATLLAVGPELLRRREPLLAALWRGRLARARRLRATAAGAGVERAGEHERQAHLALEAIERRRPAGRGGALV